MSEEWTETTLGKLCKFAGGSGFPKDHQGCRTGEYLFAKVSDMNIPKNWKHIVDSNNKIDEGVRSKLRAKIVPRGSVVFAKIGEALKAERLRIVDKPTVIDNNMMSATPIGESVDAAYLYYLLSTVGLASWAGGSALPYLTQGDLEKIEVRVPSLPEQRAIAASLGAFDDLIETNRKLMADMEGLAALQGSRGNRFVL